MLANSFTDNLIRKNDESFNPFRLLNVMNKLKYWVSFQREFPIEGALGKQSKLLLFFVE